MAEHAPSPMAIAMQWVSRIFATVVIMCVPGVGGQALDRRWGTGWLGLAGFAVGLSAGMAYLIVSARTEDKSQKLKRANRDEDRSVPSVESESRNAKRDK